MSRSSWKAALLISIMGCGPVAAQSPGFRFEDVGADRLPPSERLYTMDVGAADLDGDGDLDLVLPQEFRLNRLLINEGGRFRDASGDLPRPSASELAGGPPALQFEGAGHDSEDVSIVDLNGDGRLDLVIVSEDDVRFGRSDVHELYLNRPDGFERLLGRLPDTEGNAVAHADITGDGATDLLLAGGAQDRLLIGDGHGGFTDQTQHRLPREAATAQDAAFADLDGDGDLDIILGLEGGHALWINDGRGRFTDESSGRLPPTADVEARKVAIGDVDGDRDLDLYFAHVGWQGRQGQDRLFLNDGRGRFADGTEGRVPQETTTTLDAVFGDLDGDGDLDLVRGDVSGVTVWINDGAGRFTDVTAQVFAAPIIGANISIELSDFDGDGHADLYVGQLQGNPNGPPMRDRLLFWRQGEP